MSKGINVLITGSNRGIGLELVKQMFQKVPIKNMFATCRDPTKATELSALCKTNPNLHIISLDVTKSEEFGEAVAAVEKIVGSDGLNLLINNAGVQTQPIQMSVLELTKDDLIKHFHVNSISPLLLCKAFVPLLEKASSNAESGTKGIHKSTIVNVTALLGSIQMSNMFLVGGFYSYRASKTALNMLTKCLSYELQGKGIVTMLLNPGWVKTDMGGEEAPLTMDQSVSGIVNVLQNVGDADNGRFIAFDGKELPW